jgi:hypothetical protein
MAGDSLANFVIFPGIGATETQELAYPSPGAKTSNSVIFSSAGVNYRMLDLANAV